MGRIFRALVTLAIVGMGAAVPSVAHADAASGAAVVDDASAPVPSRVILPAGYATSRWPVVYFLNVDYDDAGVTCSQEDCGPILDTLARQPFISVLPKPAASLSEYVDWRDGSHLGEQKYLQLVSYIDDTYRTVPDRAHRVVTGISAGGYGAALLAADHPDVFGGLAAFSGVLDIMDKNPAGQALFLATSGNGPGSLLEDSQKAPHIWGQPGTDDVWWRASNPADLVLNLANTAVFDSAANDQPCQSDVDAITQDPTGYSGSPIEAVVRDTSDSFDGKADTAGVPHDSVRLPCGLHEYRPTFQTEIADWLSYHEPVLPAPASFSYRAVRSTFSVYGWTFTADPARAPEWLTAQRVSPTGLTLIGSGLTTVQTPGVFPADVPVVVRVNGVARTVDSDAAGAIRFTVDLGPAHTLAEYTPAEQVLEAAGGYFQRATITFDASGGPMVPEAPLALALPVTAAGALLVARRRRRVA